jgi:large subunit ribosomal protein L15
MQGMKKKRKKQTRMMGSHTHKRGFKKKGRGSGHRGGFGMAGTGKRADQKKTLILNLPYDYFGKEGLKTKPLRYDIINVGELTIKANGKKDLDLSKFKILGNGEIKTALNIKAYSASESAKEKIEKAGGKLTLKIEEKKERPVKEEAKEGKEKPKGEEKVKKEAPKEKVVKKKE